MIRWKQLRESLQNILEDESVGTLADLVSWVNLTLDYLNGRYAWPLMYRENIITPDSNGMFYLPGLAKEFVKIYDVDKSFTFVDKGVNKSTEIARLNEYCFYRKGMKLTDGNYYDCTLEEFSNQVVLSDGDMLTEAKVGDSVEFYDIDGFFEIISIEDDDNIEVFPAIPLEPDIQEMTHLPSGLECVYVETNTGIAYTQNVIVAYQMRHPMIYGDYDKILLPCSMSIFYRMLQLAALNAKYTNDTVVLQKLFDEAYQTEVQNCSTNQHRLNMEPVAQLGHAFGLSTYRRGSRGINASY